MIGFLKERYFEIPKPIRRFLSSCVLLFFLWKSVYWLFLHPARIIDAPLTNMVGRQTVAMLNWVHGGKEFTSYPYLATKFFEGVLVENNVVRINFHNQKSMHIADSCNGLELFVLYVGFLLSMPASIFRKLAFIIIGIPIIHLANVFRCFGLVELQIYLARYFEFAHHYLFKIVVYSIIFLLWIWFSRKIEFKSTEENV